MKKKSKKINPWYIILLFSLIFFVIIFIVGNTITIGEKFGKINIYLEYSFYGFIFLLLIIGLLYPMISIFFSPVFTLRKIRDKNGNPKTKWCKKLVKNLQNNIDLSEKDFQILNDILPLNQNEKIRKKDLPYGDQTDDKLIKYCQDRFTKAIEKEAWKTAKYVGQITALSQNSIFDMLAVSSANYHLVKHIVELLGFRPTNIQVIHLYIKIMFMTLISAGLEEINLEQYIPQILTGSLGKLLNLATASATQGAINCFATLRIAMITKNYLLLEEELDDKSLAKKSTKDALELLPVIKQIHDITTATKKGFKKAKTNTSNGFKKIINFISNKKEKKLKIDDKKQVLQIEESKK